MAKVFTFVGVAVGIMILLNLGGFTTSTGYILGQLNFLNATGDFNSTPIYVAIGLAIAALATAGVTIRILGSGISLPQYSGSIAMTAILGLFIADFVSVIKTTSAVCGVGSDCSWVLVIVTAIMSIILILYSVTLFDYARGTD